MFTQHLLQYIYLCVYWWQSYWACGQDDDWGREFYDAALDSLHAPTWFLDWTAKVALRTPSVVRGSWSREEAYLSYYCP